jgi:hypothetical protein
MIYTDEQQLDDGGRVLLSTQEAIGPEPERAESSADVLAFVRGPTCPDPATIVSWLDENRRTILRSTPDKVLLHE